MTKDVVGLGSLNLDVLYRSDDPAFLRAAGWPVVVGGEVFLPDEYLEPLEDFLRRHARYVGRSGGGSAANTLYALARMGFAAGFCGVVGEDEAGLFLRQSLAPVDVSGIKTVGGRSGTCLIVLDGSGERTLMVFPQANARLAEAGLDFSAARAARFVHLSSLVDDRARQVQVDLVASLPPRVRVSFDPGEIYARAGPEAVAPLLRRSFVVFLTAAEAALLTGEDEPPAAARRLLALGPQIVVLKCGAAGSRIFTAGEEIAVPAVPVPAVDTTGAGDVYDAGFLAGLLLGLPPAACGRLASAAAARSVTGRGRENYPDAAFLREWLAREGGER